ncbi:MAG: thioesterase family protein [Chitinophagaceae bacterium]|nr:thioesterase family protein [Chitinophagaceae bacterium]
MSVFEKQASIRWADLDPNFHLRHSVYYDLAAEQRVELLELNGLTLHYMKENHIGPIIFREECIFRREIKSGDPVMMSVRVAKMKPDASKWTIRHIFSGPNDKLLATLTVEGSWMDTKLRKLASPIPQLITEVFSKFPTTEDFTLI